MLQQFQFPIYFVHPHRERWKDVFEVAQIPDPDRMYQRFVESADIWILKTFLHLKNRGQNVQLVSDLIPEAINVVMNYDIRIKQLPYSSFIVACRADTFRCRLCHHTIVQNPHNLLSATDHLIQHWPQPGLVPRDLSRGAIIETVSYMGHGSNLWSAFSESSFPRSLKEIGVNFVVNDNPVRYHDYQRSDLVLAVRDLTETDYLSKPASKLINAWHAGVPALLGPEPAYRALRTSSLDYIEITSPDEAIREIRRLKKDPDLYRRMAENGFTRAKQFTVDEITTRWCEVLAGPVSEGFLAWEKRSTMWKSVLRPAFFASAALQNVHEKRKYVIQRDHGLRPISGRVT